MSLPSHFTVDGWIVTVEKARLGSAGKFPKAGDHEKGTIRIAEGMTRRQERGTLLHELLHNLWERGELSTRYSDTTEEWIVDTLSGWLFQVLEENPDLVAYLTRGE